jgi:DNA-binding CsgD family transcriptional regulator
MSIEAEHQSQKIPKKQHIAWRRERVAELSAQGRTEREVSAILKVSLGTVSNDLSFLNKQARDGLQFHIQRRLPAQYRECQNGLSQVLKLAWNMILTDSVNQSNRLQALSLISDCYRYQMDLSTNAGIIEEAMRFHSSNTELLNKMMMPKLELKDKDDNKNKIIESTDTNTNTNTTMGSFNNDDALIRMPSGTQQMPHHLQK